MAPRRSAAPGVPAAPAATLRRPGRPRRPDVEAVVLDAAIGLLTERGIDGTTMSAVVERSGVARATVYLRWPNRQALITAAIRRSMGRPILTSSDSVETDLRRGADRMGQLLGTPAFRSVFPALVAGLIREGPGAETPIEFDAVAPGSAMILESYERSAAAQGFRSDIPPTVVLDLVIGGQIGHFIITGRPPEREIREKLMDVVFEGLRVRGSSAPTLPDPLGFEVERDVDEDELARRSRRDGE